MLHNSSDKSLKMGWKNQNKNSGICGKFCPPKKSPPRKNENSIATENRGKIWHYWHYLNST